jgi:carboxyl-terminal processing protease
MDRSGSTADSYWWRNPLIIIALLCAITLVVTIPIVIWKTTEHGTNGQSDNKLFSRDKTALIVSSNHYKIPDYNEVYRHTSSIEALNAYLQTLDPYSKYLSPEEATFIEKRNRKNRVGIGLDLLVSGTKILGVPVKDGPAYIAGMILPAYIRSIDGHKIQYSDSNSYAFLTELPAGKIVRLSVEDNSKLNNNSFAIEVASYINEPVTYSVHNDTLVVQIRKFTGGENSRLKNILESSKQFNKLVFDLRHCPGGDLYAMVDMLSFILEENFVVASLEKANGQKELSLKTLPDRIVTDTPLYILVSEFTSSTAELFVWALRTHYPKAQVLGEATQGKCLAQDMFRIDDGSTLKLTTYEVKNAAHQSCQGKPLVPDQLLYGAALSGTQQIFKALPDTAPSTSE